MIEKDKLPKGWKWVNVEEITTVLGDGLHGTPSYSDSGDCYFINGNNLKDGKIVIKSNTKRISQDQYEKHKKKLNDKSILVSINGTLGNTAFYNGEKIILGKSACYFNVADGVDKRYVRYNIACQRFINYANKTATGSTIKNVSLRAMRDFEIALPPLPEQEKIVAKIEELFSELDKGKEQLQTALQQLKVYRQAVLKYAFEGKLTNTNVKEGELQEGWKWVKVKEIATDIQYGYTESSSKENIGPKFLRITDIQDNKVDWESVPYCKISDKDKEKKLLADGDLVFARTGATVGKSYLIKGNIPEAVYASYLIRLRFPKDISDKYVWNFFQSHSYWQQIIDGQVGIGQPNVNGTRLGQLILPLAPLEEQQEIVAEIERRLSVCDKIEETINQALTQTETLRQSILKKAFEGKLV